MHALNFSLLKKCDKAFHISIHGSDKLQQAELRLKNINIA